MPRVRLKGHRQGSFTRYQRDADGKRTEPITFAPGQVRDLSDAEFAAVAKDIAPNCLELVEDEPIDAGEDEETVEAPADDADDEHGQRVTSQKAVAEYFAVSPEEVKRWLAAGCPGEAGRYDLEAIDHWLDAEGLLEADRDDQDDHEDDEQDDEQA